MPAAAHHAKASVEGVPLLQWGRSGECTFVGALAAATSATRHRFSYQTLLGATGLAFRVRWYQGKESRWCPSSAVGELPEPIEAARQATGYELLTECDFEDKLDKSVPMILEEIDHHRPVLCYDDKINVALIVGYEDEGRTLLVHDYFNPEGPVRRDPKEMVRFSVRLGKRHMALHTSEAALQGIKLAIQNWHRVHEPEEPTATGYWLGPAAYAKWAEDLQSADEMPRDLQDNLFFVSWWNFDVLCDCRLHAGPYLREITPFFPPAIAGPMNEASHQYDRSAQLLHRCIEERDAFFGPWSGKGIEDWTPEVQEREAHILHEVCGLEDWAIRLLEEATEKL